MTSDTQKKILAKRIKNAERVISNKEKYIKRLQNTSGRAYCYAEAAAQKLKSAKTATQKKRLENTVKRWSKTVGRCSREEAVAEKSIQRNKKIIEKAKKAL